MGTDTYRGTARSVYRAGRALADATQFGDAVEIRMAQTELLRAVGAHEAGGDGVAGFGPSTEADVAAGTGADTLGAILLELELGRTLLSAGAVVEDPGTPDRAASFTGALDALDRTTSTPPPPQDGRVGFGDGQPPPLMTVDTLTEQLSQTIDGIVDRTITVGRNVLAGLSTVPVSVLQPALGGVIAVLPQVGALVQAGLRAVRRAVEAMYRIVPEEIRTTLREWAAEWWGRRAETAADALVGGLLSADAIRRTAAAVLATIDPPPDGRLGDGQRRLAELDERHRRISSVVDRIVTAITTILGPAVAVFAVAAPWLYGAGAAGFLLAFGAAVWIGRDYLDSGTLAERVSGVRSIIDGLVG